MSQAPQPRPASAATVNSNPPLANVGIHLQTLALMLSARGGAENLQRYEHRYIKDMVPVPSCSDTRAPPTEAERQRILRLDDQVKERGGVAVTQDDLLYRFIYGCSRSPQSWGMCGWHVGPWTSIPRPITAGGAS